MKEIILHVLDLAENSVCAGAKTIQIDISENLDKDILAASIEDDGRGMDQEMAQKVADPFYTSRTTRNVGLGIPLLKEAAEACDGGMRILSKPGTGTRVEVSFRHSHIDRMPLGDLPATFTELIIMHPEVHWVFRYLVRCAGEERAFDFDDKPVKKILEDIPLTHPDVLAYFGKMLEEGVDEAREILRPIFHEERQYAYCKIT